MAQSVPRKYLWGVPIAVVAVLVLFETSNYLNCRNHILSMSEERVGWTAEYRLVGPIEYRPEFIYCRAKIELTRSKGSRGWAFKSRSTSRLDITPAN